MHTRRLFGGLCLVPHRRWGVGVGAMVSTNDITLLYRLQRPPKTQNTIYRRYMHRVPRQ